MYLNKCVANACMTHLLLFSLSIMAHGSQYVHAEKYVSSDVKRYAQLAEADPEYLAFLFPYMNKYLKSQVPGKRVLDIGCGMGSWSCVAAKYDAKSVDGFDIQEEMVELAKQATYQFSTVTVSVGDVMDMPYDDNSFDVALGFYVTCALRPKACVNLFKGIHRVLAPGGKAVMNCIPKLAFERMALRSGADRILVEKKIAEKLMNLLAYPSQDDINDSFQDLHDVIEVFFAPDENGHLKRITNADELTNGQAIWCKCYMMTFACYFYDEHFYQQQIKAAGLNLDKIESYYTEERRIAYNSTNPEVELDGSITDTPPFVMYHLSIPVD